MLSETNKTLSRRFFDEVFGKGKLNVLDEIIAKDHVNSGPGTLPGLPAGPEGTKQLVTVYRNAFPDLRFTIDEQIAEGDKVVTRWTGYGTHKAELVGIPATGKPQRCRRSVRRPPQTRLGSPSPASRRSRFCRSRT